MTICNTFAKGPKTTIFRIHTGLLSALMLQLYALNINLLKTHIKLPDWRKITHNCRVIGSVWVLFLSTNTRSIYPTHFAGNPYTACIMDTISPMYAYFYLECSNINIRDVSILCAC